MPPRVDFYLLPQTTLNAGGRTLCRIIEKAYLQQQSSIISCEEASQADMVDKLLWTYHDISFIPHGCWPNLNIETETPIIIGLTHQLAQMPQYAMLFNLSAQLPEHFQQFQRIIEIIPNEEKARGAGRERYRYYRDQECELHSHNLT